jgi:hypothetical protein
MWVTAIALAFCGAAVFGSTSSSLGSVIGRPQSLPLSIRVEDSRPLSAVVDQLERDYGWSVTYEDPPFVDSSEIEDVTDRVSRVPHPQKRTFVPRGGVFQFDFQPPSDGVAQASATLAALVQRYNSTLQGPVFALGGDAELWHVFPRMFRDATGILRQYTPVLDTKVTIPAKDRTALEMIQATVSALADRRQPIGLGLVSTRALAHTHVYGGAHDEPARNVLSRMVLAARPAKVIWVLFFSPDPPGKFALSFVSVPPRGR